VLEHLPLISAPPLDFALLASLASPETDLGDWGSRSPILHDILMVTWGLNLVNWIFLGKALDWFSVRPRTSIGLLGIVFSPFLHGNLVHLLGNSLVFFILGSLVLVWGVPTFIGVTLIVAIAEGLGVWIFGRSLNHVGGSGVIFGYFGFLLFGTFFNQNLTALVLSLIVGIFYWWLLPGLMPVKGTRISWEGHLFGFLAGALSNLFLPLINSFFV
jgi:membrane associated rhomboid family serine protease